MQHLRFLLGFIQERLNDTSSSHVTSQPTIILEYWNKVTDCINDCHKTLENLESFLDRFMEAETKNSKTQSQVNWEKMLLLEVQISGYEQVMEVCRRVII